MRSLKLSGLIRRNPDRPTLKQRAESLKATAAKVMRKQAKPAANPRLVALVEEWTRLGIQLNDPAIGDDFVDEISDKHSAVQIEIGLFPCRSLADLCAKIPVFRDEMADAASGLGEGRVEDTLAGSVWTGLIRDIELLNGATPEPQKSEPDPALAAIAASRAAEAEMAAFQIRAEGGMSPALFAEEGRLCERQGRTRDIALATAPTTRAGQLALVEYVRFTHELHGIRAGDGPIIDDAHIWKDTHAALMRALAAPTIEPARLDLSGVSLSHLGTLQETFRSLGMHASGELQAPWCFDEKGERYNAAGRVLEAEVNRLGGFVDAIAREAGERISKGDRERDSRLEILLRHELLCEGRVADPALLAEINTAWGA